MLEVVILMGTLAWVTTIIVAYVVGRRHAKDIHHHVWGQWVLKEKHKLVFDSGRESIQDLQQRECLGCGYVERRRVRALG